MKFSTLACLLLAAFFAHSQSPRINPALLQNTWNARWIGPGNGPHKDYGVYHYRKTFELNTTPAKFVVHVSADNRYKLFVNGKFAGNGPARSDLYNWYFETIDIAPYLNTGKNVIAALVWNMGADAPVAQLSSETAFILQADDDDQKFINSNSSWKIKRSVAYEPTSRDNMPRLRAYFAVGSNDKVDGNKVDWNWQTLNFNDSTWTTAAEIAPGQPNGAGSDNRWTLNPRPIPPMEMTKQRINKIVRVNGINSTIKTFDGKNAITIPANTKASILLDQEFNTIGYPNVELSGGKNAAVTITYAESLVDDKRNKGNRNETEGKHIAGYYDEIIADGGANRHYETLWLRTWRYLQVDVETRNEPLIIHDLYGNFSAYPFKENARFKSNDSSLNKIWEAGWRTARLCAGETYFDCPYYEQLQYEGDTRIQELISLYVSGDDRLMRKAILEFYYSRIAEGMPQGRYPSSRLQIIPPYSLIWVSMVYDYWMHRNDDAFVKQFLLPIAGVLNWYETKLDNKTGLVGALPWWNFVDYTDKFNEGVPPNGSTGNSSIISLGYLYALQHARELNRYFKEAPAVSKYTGQAAKLKAAIYNQCFDKRSGLLADTPEKNIFSQHAQSLGVLTGTIPMAMAKTVMTKAVSDPSLTPTTFYFRFYLNKALKHAGLGDLYYEQLKPWRDMLAIGLTTFAEKPEPARSDCHAWSASPVYNFFETICGIEPASAHFATVKIEPAFGGLTEVVASMPHPGGEIRLALKRKGSGVEGHVELPEKVSGNFKWKGKIMALRPGDNRILL